MLKPIKNNLPDNLISVTDAQKQMMIKSEADIQNGNITSDNDLNTEEEQWLSRLDDTSPSTSTRKDEFIDFLLKAPVYTDTDIAIIEENRKSINAWRTKS